MSWVGDMTTQAGTGLTERAPAPMADGGGGQGDDAVWSSPARRIAFRVLSVLLGLFLLASFVFGLLEVVLMWLPDQFFIDNADLGEDYPGGIPVHRSHFMAIGLVAWTVVPAVLVQLRKPWRRVAPMLVAAVMAVTALVAYGLAGTFQEWVVEDLVMAVPILVLATLHPRAAALLRRPAFDRTMGGLAVVAAVPWAVYGLAQARLQFLDQPGDIHTGLEHWATALLLAVAVVTCAVVGASDHDGWRLPAWTAAAASMLFGVHSLVFPGLASGLPTVAAVGAVAWGGAYAVAVVRRARGEVDSRVAPEPGPATGASRLGLASGGEQERA